MNTKDALLIARAGTALQRAQWAAGTFAKYEAGHVTRIVRAVAQVAHDHAQDLAEKAVKETGFGVVEDKVAKNRALSRGFVEAYATADFSSPRLDPDNKMIHTPKPAGVIFALTPSTSPVAALYFKVLSALLTRNAIVISPHPRTAQTCTEAAELLSLAATVAGAPDGVIQILREPTVPLIEATMADHRVNLILATGGAAVVKAAYRSGTPALGVGPGNAPVVVDETANVEAAARHIVASKTFDNSVLCTAESVLIAVQSVAKPLLEQLRRHGGHVCSPSETEQLRQLVFPDGRFNTDIVGISAPEIAKRAGFTTGGSTRLLLTPITHMLPEEVLTREKLSPILAVREVEDFDRAVLEAKSLLRIVGIGHSAVLHSETPQRVLDFSTALPVHRISVNAPGSLGNAGLGTTLPVTMSVGTGFAGGSSSGDNLSPEHLVQWNRTAYSDDPAVKFPQFSGLAPSQRFDPGTRVPPHPVPSNARDAARPAVLAATSNGSETSAPDSFREELRRIVLEELRELIGAR